MKFGRFIQTWSLYEKIPMKVGKKGKRSSSVLPDEGFDWREVNLLEKGYAYFPVMCLPARHDGQRKHRVLAMCRCQRVVPFGRMGQHRNACRQLMRCTAI